jgi:molybdopterin converting factor small subunit
MVRVVLPLSLVEAAGGEREFDVGVTTVRELFALLEERIPGIRERIEGRMAVAIDGEIYNDPLLESIDDGSEVHFLPRIGGG